MNWKSKIPKKTTPLKINHSFIHRPHMSIRPPKPIYDWLFKQAAINDTSASRVVVAIIETEMERSKSEIQI